MTLDPKNIVEYIRKQSDHPMKVKELAKALGVAKADYNSFRSTLKSLLHSGQLLKLKRGRIGLASEMDVLVGEISITRSGVGFLLQEGDKEDILIPARHLLTALDGDRVMVRLTGESHGRASGTVIKVVERANRNIVGVFQRTRNFTVVIPDVSPGCDSILIPANATLDAVDGEKVVIQVTFWEDPYFSPEGEIVERLGFPGDPGVDMLTVLRKHNLPQEFPPNIIVEAEAVASKSTRQEESRRIDLTKEIIYTIDPADAKDFDDAVSVQETADGYKLGVYIADVSYFVQPGTELDKEGLRRGNSVYLPGMVIPMLPECLSNDVCSLKPNRRRLAHGVDIEFDKAGKMLSWKVVDVVIKSRARLSYEEVQEYFDGAKPSPRVQRVAENLTVARKLAKLLSSQRIAQGSLDFDLSESKIVMNESGEVIELGNRVRLESHRLVEEFMLAANRAVALEIFRKGQDCLYRVHARPDMERLEAFSSMMERLGYTFPVSPQIRPIDFSRFLKTIADEPEADFINELMLRSMQKACYQRHNVGHFGLAFKHYAHFTSPIRRYPDLLVHRLLRALSGRNQYEPAFGKQVSSLIDRVGKYCSDTERAAESAEREAVKVKQVSFMARHIGDEFAGVISGVTNYGFFVRLDDLGAEGLVRVSSVDDDYYRYVEDAFCLTGSRSGRSFRLGDQVEVSVIKVDQVRNEIDLGLTKQASRKRKSTSQVKAKKKTKARRRRGKKR